MCKGYSADLASGHINNNTANMIARAQLIWLKYGTVLLFLLSFVTSIYPHNDQSTLGTPLRMYGFYMYPHTLAYTVLLHPCFHEKFNNFLKWRISYNQGFPKRPLHQEKWKRLFPHPFLTWFFRHLLNKGNLFNIGSLNRVWGVLQPCLLVFH